MKSTPFIKPYNGEKTTLKEISPIGVYLIRKGKEIVYVGYSFSHVKKTLYRHFQSWKDKTQNRATFPKEGYEIKVSFCTSEAQARIIELRLIQKHEPKENLQITPLTNKFKRKADELLKKVTAAEKEDYINDPF